MVRLLKSAMENHPERSRLKVQDTDLACFLLCNSVMGVVHTMVFDDTQEWDNEALVRDLTEMACSYLLSPNAAPQGE